MNIWLILNVDERKKMGFGIWWIQKCHFFKSTHSQYFLSKILGIGPWVNRIHGWAWMWLNLYSCQAVLKKIFLVLKCILRLFSTNICRTFCRTGWATSMSFASIYPINPRINPWNYLWGTMDGIFMPCQNARNFDQSHWHKIFCRMCGLAMMMYQLWPRLEILITFWTVSSQLVIRFFS